MICFDLVKKMRNVREWYNLTAAEQALYYELVFICNEKGWVDFFPCSNQSLAHRLGMSVKSLLRIRNRLFKSGLICFRPGKGQQALTLYSLTIDLANGQKLPEDINLSLPQPGEENNGAGREVHACNDSVNRDTNRDMNRDTNRDMNRDMNRDKNSALYKTNTKTNIISNDEQTIQNQFETFRKAYPGTKGGFETEYTRFRKKHSDYRKVVGLLLPAIEKLKRWRAQRKMAGLFVPEYPHLSTWLNQRRWEAELETSNTNSHENEPCIVD